MHKRSPVPRLSFISTFARIFLRVALLAGLLGIAPAASALADGPELAPFLVKDINPGVGYSYPHYLTDVNGTLFFSVDDGDHGEELWRSDSTETGTVLVKDINPGEYHSYPESLINLKGTLFFIANDGSHGEELWRSDGTPAGTVLIKDIYPGSGSSNPANLTTVDDRLFFMANDGINGNELWRSDGTSAGTVLVKDLDPGINGADIRDLIDVDGTLFFNVDDGTHGRELWRSDGTAKGTMLVKDICPGMCSSYSVYYMNMAAINDTLFFVAYNGELGRELWKSDGTEAGTILVKDTCPGVCSSISEYYLYMIAVKDTLFFTADDSVYGAELWRSDGTAAGTQMIADICPDLCGSFTGYWMDQPAAVDGTLFFIANDGTHGRELWRSDGTKKGTLLVKDIFPGREPSNPEELTVLNGMLFFRAYDAPYGQELWQSDGTEAGTMMVKDIYPGAGDSDPEFLTVSNGRLFFVAYDSSIGYRYDSPVNPAINSGPAGPELWSLGYFTNLPFLLNGFASGD